MAVQWLPVLRHIKGSLYQARNVGCTAWLHHASFARRPRAFMVNFQVVMAMDFWVAKHQMLIHSLFYDDCHMLCWCCKCCHHLNETRRRETYHRCSRRIMESFPTIAYFTTLGTRHSGGLAREKKTKDPNDINLCMCFCMCV